MLPLSGRRLLVSLKLLIMVVMIPDEATARYTPKVSIVQVVSIRCPSSINRLVRLLQRSSALTA
jgi:hypothetical protein